MVFLVLPLASGCQDMADRSDQEALREQARIPPFAELVTFKGHPFTVGPREGLNLSATFSIPSGKVQEFEADLAGKDSQWQPLPISPAIRERILFRFPGINITATRGFFRCRTAADNVLYEQDTASCLKPKALVMVEKDPPRWRRQEVPLSTISAYSDIILTMYDLESKTISAGIAAAY
jgi:hypothetical protein